MIRVLNLPATASIEDRLVSAFRNFNRDTVIEQVNEYIHEYLGHGTVVDFALCEVAGGYNIIGARITEFNWVPMGTDEEIRGYMIRAEETILEFSPIFAYPSVALELGILG